MTLVDIDHSPVAGNHYFSVQAGRKGIYLHASGDGLFADLFCDISGGAGGKGTWGAPGDELFADEACRDKSDPNYDSDTQVM